MKKQLRYAHIGDLHITKAKEQNYIDLLSIIAQIETQCSNQLDFVFLPGDNADNGLPEQYKLVETALKMLSIPVYIIPGDHDMEQGSLENYMAMKFTHSLPKAVIINEYHCIFLDSSGRGKGGPDFRLLDEQIIWLEAQLFIARQDKMEVVLFMHTYPADLKDVAEINKLNQLIADNDVVLVDMGHTHYNELANDGHTIFSATRSTGQIEEGPVGYTLVSINEGKVSWRFKLLQEPFPYVIITAPADYRLIRSEDHKIGERVEIQAIVFGSKKIKNLKYKIADKEWQAMVKQVDDSYTATDTDLSYMDLLDVMVEATDITGRPSIHNIKIATPLYPLNKKQQNGSNKNSIGAWPENGIFGTQLGPNQNGKPS